MKIRNKIRLIVFMAALVGCFANNKSIKIEKMEKVMTEKSKLLFAAIERGDIVEARELLRTCVITIYAKDKEGRTALMWASKNGQLEIAKELLKARSEVNAKDKEGRTALMWASENGQLEIAKELLKAGAEVNAKDGCGRTVLLYARFAIKVGYIDIKVIRELLKAGADVNAKDRCGGTYLMDASGDGDIEVIKEFLKAKAEVNAKTKEGYTALMCAGEKGNIDIVRELLKAGADVNARDVYGGTALLNASKRENLKLVRELLRAGADVNAEDKSGNTALKYATENYNMALVYQLLAAGAEVKQKLLYDFLKPTDGELEMIYLGLHKSVSIDRLRKYCAYLSERESVIDKIELENIVQKYLINERLGGLVYDIVSNMIMTKEEEGKARLDINLLTILHDYISYLNKKNVAIIIDQKIKGAEETPVIIIDYATLKEILMLTRSDENEIIKNLIKLKVRWERSGKDIAELKKMEEADILSQLFTAM